MKKNTNLINNTPPGFLGAIAAIAIVLVLAFVCFWGIHQLHPPTTVPADAPSDVFSAERALKHLKVIAATPHPIGTPENRTVRDYLIQEIRALGLKPEIQKAKVMRQWSSHYLRGATVENIVVRLKGTGNSKAVLLMSHYDTVPNAFGATDDGSGVVTLLETLRALKALPPLKNDIIFLFTDGEELLLLGAKAFVEQHPWVKDVGLVMNFEGGGSRGPVLMFETSDENGWLIKEFAKAAPYPMANSLIYEIYRRLPNDTDLSEFKKIGCSGFNFAYIDNPYDYHSANDNLQNIDERSIQHHGSYALALTRHFGDLNLHETKARNSIYFNTIGFGFIHYSEKWVIPFIILTGLFYILILILGFRAKELKIPGIMFGFIAFLANLVIAPTAVTCLYRIIQKFYPGSAWWLLFYHHKLLLLGFVFLSITISVALYRLFLRGIKVWQVATLAVALNILLCFAGLFHWKYLLISVIVSSLLFFIFRKENSVWDLAMGSLLGWVIFIIAGSIIILGSNFFIWPLFFSLFPLGWIFITRPSHHLSIKNLVLFPLFSVPALLWFSSLIYLYFIATGLSKSGIVMVLVMLSISLMIPHIYFITRVDRWLFPGILTLLGVILILSGTIGASFSERYRKPNCIFYAINSHQNRSIWGSSDLKLDEWTSNFLSDNPETSTLTEFLPSLNTKIWSADAPASNLPAPELTVIEDFTRDEIRTLKIHLKSGREAPVLNIFIHPDANIIKANLNGMKIEGFDQNDKNVSKKWRRWIYYASPRGGISLMLRIKPSKSLVVKLTDISYDFPQLQDFVFKPRPKQMMPAPYTLSNMTLVTKTFTLNND